MLIASRWNADLHLKIKDFAVAAQGTINEILYHVPKIIETVHSQAAKTIKRLELFIADCTKIIAKIHSFSGGIPEKYVYCPLENMLIRGFQNFVNLQGPELILADSYSSPFSLHLPTLAHQISTYNFSIHFSDQQFTIQSPLTVKTVRNPIKHYDPTCRFLGVSEHEVLLTGGVNWQTKVYYFEISKQEKKEFPGLNIGRYKHTMGWIDGFSAVLGGINSVTGEIMASVEVFTDKWVTYPDFNYPRCNLTAVSSYDSLYIIGGNITAETLTETIEQWSSGWKVLNAKLQYPCCNIGAINIGGEFLIFGGRSHKVSGNITRINLETGEIELESFMKNIFFKNNTLVVDSMHIKGTGYDKENNDRLCWIEYEALNKNLIVKKNNSY